MSHFFNFIYLFICHIPHPPTAESAQQRQEKRQEGKSEEKRIGAEGETIHPNPGNW